MNLLEKMNIGSSTHIRLFSGNVKNFDLHKIDIDSFLFGFTLKRNMSPVFESDEDLSIFVNLEKEGLLSLINFLNRVVDDFEN